MWDSKLIMVSSLVALATAYAGELSPESENKTPDLLSKLLTDIYEFNKNTKAENKDIPWIDNDLLQHVRDTEKLSEFLPVGSSYENEEYDEYDEEDATERTETPPVPDDEASTGPASAAVPNTIRSKMWTLYAVIFAIMTIKLF